MANHRGFTILLCRSGASKELDSNIENGIGSSRGKNNSSGKGLLVPIERRSLLGLGVPFLNVIMLLVECCLLALAQILVMMTSDSSRASC